MTHDLLDEIKNKWNIPVTLPMTVPWGKDDVVWLVQEVERLRRTFDEIAELCGDGGDSTPFGRVESMLSSLTFERDEALRLLATRVEAKRLDEAQEEIAALREACALALSVMEQKNKVNVPPLAKFIEVKFAPEDIAVLRAALEKKP